MRVYRICRTEFVDDLTGTGAKLYGGRWNKQGTAVLYTAHARSLAVLELIVNFSSRAALDLDYSFVELDFPGDSVFDLTDKMLPKYWNLSKSAETLHSLTESWIERDEYLAMKVPSAIIKEECNYILNPHHKNFARTVKIVAITELDLDHRLKKDW